jgi:hypothetical protein
MLKAVMLCFAVLLSSSVALAQRNAPPSKAELAEITERGRQLAEYDVAAWYATDVVLAVNPREGSVAHYIAKKIGNAWTVVFGRFNESRDKFLIVYEANQGASPQEFNVKKHDPPKEDTGFYLFATKASQIVQKDFQGAARTYNVVALPAPSGQIYVYLVPAQTEQGVYPLGGDVRYLVSQDGAKIIEKRQLHKSIIEFKSPPDGQKVEAGFHTAILDDIPEDTDVFHVLSRKPSVPEMIATRRYLYRIETDGAMNYLMTMEEFEKQVKK